MTDRKEISTILKYKLGYPFAIFSVDTTKIDTWVETLDLDTFVTDEFTHSLCRTSNGVEDNLKINYAPLLEIVGEYVHQYIDEMRPMCEIDVEMEHPWVNIYGHNGFQDCHDHQGPGDNDFSWSYVHESGKSSIIFKNRNATNSDMNLIHLLDEYKDQFEYVPSKKEKGTLYIFPSSILHAVTPNKSKLFDRITFTGNVKINRI